MFRKNGRAIYNVYFCSKYVLMELSYNKEELKVLKTVGEAADKLGLETYAIGGFVRDKILGRPTRDIDIVTVGDGIALAKETAHLFSEKLQVHVFKNFGTAQIKWGGIEIEFVGARKESYRQDSRKPAIVPGTRADDQKRRDFTINALSISLNKENFNQIDDPFGGREDLENRLIRTPLDPAQTFSDDPLRMMRAIRFATQLQFTIEKKTLNGITTHAERIRIVSRERITEELNKIILSAQPSIGFKLLFDTGLLRLIFPKMTALAGVEVRDGKGHKDNFYHTIKVLDNIAQNTDDLWLRWAAILHDIAKPVTKRFDPKQGWTFHGHEVVGARMVPKIFKKMKLPLNEKMRFVKKMVALHLRPISLTDDHITDSALRRLLFDAGDDLESLMKLCNADITSKNKRKVERFKKNFEIVQKKLEEIEEKDRIRNWQPPIDGKEIMDIFGLKPSKTVGDIKDAIREAILDGEIENKREAAYDFMIERAASMGLKPHKTTTS